MLSLDVVLKVSFKCLRNNKIFISKIKKVLSVPSSLECGNGSWSYSDHLWNYEAF